MLRGNFIFLIILEREKDGKTHVNYLPPLDGTATPSKVTKMTFLVKTICLFNYYLG